jgi:hypothetical protein
MKSPASPKYESEDGPEVYDAPPPYELRSTGELLDSSATITGWFLRYGLYTILTIF